MAREGSSEVQLQLQLLSKVRGSVDGHIQRIEDIVKQGQLIELYCGQNGESEVVLDQILQMYKKYFKEDIFSEIKNAAILDLNFSI